MALFLNNFGTLAITFVFRGKFARNSGSANLVLKTEFEKK
jgi:hypothetical protein